MKHLEFKPGRIGPINWFILGGAILASAGNIIMLAEEWGEVGGPAMFGAIIVQTGITIGAWASKVVGEKKGT